MPALGHSLHRAEEVGIGAVAARDGPSGYKSRSVRPLASGACAPSTVAHSKWLDATGLEQCCRRERCYHPAPLWTACSQRWCPTRIAKDGPLTLDDQRPSDRFQIDPEIIDRFPGYAAVIVVAEGVRNDPSGEAIRRDLHAASAARAAEFADGGIPDNPAVASWREAYSAFGSKPSRYRSSIESLLRRSVRGGVPSISTLVDIYNTVSLRHLVPVGGEDLAALSDSLVLTFAAGGESFEADWADGDDLIRAGEVVWKDARGVTCRRWNWRQSARTSLTASTRSAYFVLDCLPPTNLEACIVASEDLIDRLVAAHRAAVTGVTLLGADPPVSGDSVAN